MSWRRFPTRSESRRLFSRSIGYAAGLLLVVVLFSFLLFASDALIMRLEGGRTLPIWEIAATKAAPEERVPRIIPEWFTWNYYATYWGARLTGNLDYSINPSPSMYMRAMGSINEEGKLRRARSIRLILSAVTMGLVVGGALGLVLRLRRRLSRRRVDFALLDTIAYLPVVTLCVLGLAALVQGWGFNADWRVIAASDWLIHWDILIYPASILAIPTLPAFAGLWLGAGAADVPWGSPAWLIGHFRATSCALGTGLLIVVGWVPVVEWAFRYPGMSEWLIRGLTDVNVVQAGLLMATALGVVGLAMGGRPQPYIPSADAARIPHHGLAIPPWEGWLRRLAKNDGFVISGYLVVLVVGVLAFAGLFPGMAPADVNALQPLHPVSAAFPMGTDVVGRNIWRLMVEGSRVYLSTALAVALAALFCAAGLRRLAMWRNKFSAPIRFGQWTLTVLPGIWWPLAVISISGRSHLWMAVGVFMFSLPIMISAIARIPGLAGGGGIGSPKIAHERVLSWCGLLLMGTALNFLMFAHLAYLAVGTRYPGPEVGTTLSYMFKNLETDWLVVSGPALMVMVIVLGLFLPGRLILAQIDRRRWEMADGSESG